MYRKQALIKILKKQTHKIMRKLVFILMILTSMYGMAQKVNLGGTVVDVNGQPLPFVSVVVKGTQVGTVTNAAGKFAIKTDNKTALVFSFMGYITKEVSIDNLTQFHVVLQENSVALKDVVVTALGISREKKALGYAVQDVNAKQLTQTGDAEVTQALAGKVAGVDINASGTGVGGSTKVTIRGNSSLSDNNNPLWIVDGIPFSDNTVTGNNQWGGVDIGGGIADLNPNDIASITVLKGPSAAALYGSRAGNGVIIVTTKKGSLGQKDLGITYNYNDTYSVPSYYLDLQNTYGQGSNGVVGDNISSQQTSPFSSAWGPALDGHQVVAWYDNTKTVPYVAHPNNIKDFFQTGNTQSHNISVSGGNEKGSFRASLGNDYIKGNLQSNTLNKSTLGLVSSYNINKFLKVDADFNYVNSSINNDPHLGYYGIMSYLYTMPSNIDVHDLYTYRLNANALKTGNYEEQYYVPPTANDRNPYAQTQEYQNTSTRNRFFGFVSATIKFSNDLNLKVRTGMDYYNYQLSNTYLWNDIVYGGQNPSINFTNIEFKEQNSDFLLNYNKKVSDLTIGASLGGNLMSNTQKQLYGSSGQLAVQGYYFLDLGTNKNTTNSLDEKEIHSVYGFVDLGYKDYLYLDLTARNDWSSTLPVNNRSYFYPSASLSAVITEMLDNYGVTYNRNIFSFAKVRASVAQVGKDTDPYQLMNAYTTSKSDFGLVQANPPSVLANANLKPEIKTSYEVGANMKFFNNRVGIDFTYYDSKTKNQVLQIPQVQSSGYASAYANAGLISNKGIEVTLSGTAVKTNDFNLDFALNLASNKTMVDELDPLVKTYIFSSLNNGLEVVAIEGHKLGEIYGQGYQLNADGSKLIGSNGLPVATTNDQVLGCIQPDYTGSFSVDAGYKGFYCSGLFTFQKGGDVYSYTEAIAAYAGTAKCTQDRSSMVVSGDYANGTKNTTAVTAQNYWQSGLPQQQFIYSASFLKLKELAIGYNFSKKMLDMIPTKPINNLRLAFVADNLAYFIKHTPGTTPDGAAMSSNIFSQAIDFSGLPGARTFGLSLNVGF
jgi:TonB-linked SusC/RagA family outer membrane protein